MSNEKQNSGKFISSSKLSATVPAFVPGIAHTGTGRLSSDLVIKSTLSPLVPEFHPSGSFTPPLSTSYQPGHRLQYNTKQEYLKHEKIHLQENAPPQAYQTTFPPSKKIAAKIEKAATTRKGNRACEAQNGSENTTSEHSAEKVVNVSKKKKQTKKKESSDLIQQQDKDKLSNKSSTEKQRVSHQLKAKGFVTISHPDCTSLSFSSETSPENTGDNRKNETVISDDLQPDKKQFPPPNLTVVSYSDKVKSLSLKSSGTSNHSVAKKSLVKDFTVENGNTNRSIAEKCWVTDFTVESSSEKNIPSDIKQSSKVRLGQTTRAFNLDNNLRTAAKSGHSGDALKKPPDSTCKTAWGDSEYYKLKYGESLKSQTTSSQQILKTGKQVERNHGPKKMSCDDDENWRVKKEDVCTLDSSTSHKTDSLKKMNIKNLNTESFKKRTCRQEGIHVNSKKYEKDVIEQEKSVAPIVVEEDAKTSRKQQNSCHLGSSSTEAAYFESPVNKLGSDFPSSSQEHKMIQMPNASVVASSDNKIMEGEFPDLKESVKIKRLSTTEGRTFDYKMTVTSTKPSAPMSYSAVLRSTPQPKPVVISPAWENEQSTTHGGLLKVPSQAVASKAEIEAGQGEPTMKKKKKKKKKKKTGETGEQSQESGSAKRTQKPIQFDLGVMLQTISKSSQDRPQQSGKKLVVATGVLPTQLPPTSPTDIKPGVKNAQKGENKTPHNKLDSTAPVIKRGKERETPARKKPSALKKIILKEREEKKKARETTETEDVAETCDDKENRTCESDDENIAHDEVQSHSEDETTNPGPLPPTDQEIAAEIHSRRFREYCFQIPDKEVDTVASELLKELVRFQDRQFHKDPVKAKAKRRFVLGLREVNKHLKLRKLKCVIISSNVERIKSAGGLDDTLGSIINLCQVNKVPVVFALKRHLLGKVLLKKVPVSIVGIFNYDGAQDHFKTLIELTEKTRQAYTDKWQETREKLESLQKETSDAKRTEREMVSSADVKQVDDITQMLSGDPGTANNLANDAESSDDDDDDDDDSGKEEESDSNRNRYSEKENIVIENDLEIQDI